MYAIAEFGSMSRNTADSYSDRDLLIVCPMSQRYALHNRYSAMGYSVSWLSENQLIHMQANGSLFIQHLKHEASIKIDSGSKLRNFLDQCELISPTDAEISRCKSTIQFIASWSDSSVLSAWKADFLFCISRDYLIKILATKGQIAFGLEDIERELKYFIDTKNENLRYLYSLRMAKSAYRSGSEFTEKLADITKHWFDVLHCWFGINKLENCSVSVDSDVSSLIARTFNSPYERLRSLEGVYLLARANGILHPEHSQLMKHIVQPNMYRSSQRTKQKVVQQYLSDVVALLDDNFIQHTQSPLHFDAFQISL